MSEQKPLHVRVAEALGWTDIEDHFDEFYEGYSPEDQECLAVCKNKGDHIHGDIVPDYDTDWSATGPLIEKYQINLGSPVDHTGWEAASPTQPSMAHHDPDGFKRWESRTPVANGKTPLEAVCHLILTLYEAGKLKAA